MVFVIAILIFVGVSPILLPLALVLTIVAMAILGYIGYFLWTMD